MKFTTFDIRDLCEGNDVAFRQLRSFTRTHIPVAGQKMVRANINGNDTILNATTYSLSDAIEITSKLINANNPRHKKFIEKWKNHKQFFESMKVAI